MRKGPGRAERSTFSSYGSTFLIRQAPYLMPPLHPPFLMWQERELQCREIEQEGLCTHPTVFAACAKTCTGTEVALSAGNVWRAAGEEAEERWHRAFVEEEKQEGGLAT